MPSSRGSSRSRDRTQVSSLAFADGLFTLNTIWEALKKKCHTAEEMGSTHGTSKAPTTKSRLKNQVQTGFEPMTFSLRDQCFTTWPQMRKYLKIREEYLLPF